MMNQTAILVAIVLALCSAVAEEPIQKFAKAVKSGDRATVETMLAEGLDPNTRIPRHWLNYTPLFIAVNNDDLELTKILLEAGADPKLEDDNGDPVMVHASDHDTIRVAQHLISQGHPIDARNSKGITALMRDAPYAKENDIQAKIDLGANPNLIDSEGNTSLMIAAGSRNLAAMKTLVAAGADVDVQNVEGKNALMLAMDELYNTAEKAPEAVRILIAGGADLELRDQSGKTALLNILNDWWAEEPIVDTLLEAKPRLDVLDPETGASPLFTAVQRDMFPKAITTMLERGADPTIIDNDGVDLIMLAARNADIPLIRALQKRGLALTRKDKSGASIVHWATMNSPPRFRKTSKEERAAHSKEVIDILRFLLEQGIPLDPIDSKGITPLHIAAKLGVAPVVEFLIPHYSVLNIRDKSGRTILHEAASSGSTAAVDLMLPHVDLEAVDHKGRTALWEALIANRNELALHLLRAGANIDAVDKTDRTLLEAAMADDNFEHIRLLIDQGADPGKLAAPDILLLHAVRHFHDHPVNGDHYSFRIEVLAPLVKNINAPDAEGLTPLMWAASSNNQSALTAILKQKPNLNARSHDGRTPLMWAASARAAKSIEALRASGADETLHDHAGKTAEDWSTWAANYSRPAFTSTVSPDQAPLNQRIARTRAVALAKYLEKDTWDKEHRISGYSPLHLAATLGDLAAIETFIDRGAPIDIRLEDRTTPLMSAATNGHSEAVRLLLKKKADVTLRNSNEQRALDLAIRFEHWDTTKILLHTKGALVHNESSLLQQLVFSENTDLLREALKAGAKIIPPEERKKASADTFDKTTTSSAKDPLVAAARSKNLDMLKILHEFPKASGSDDPYILNSALHYAADAGKLPHTKYLIDQLGADPDSLLDHGMGGVTRVDSPEKDKPQPVRGYTALSRALEEGHDNVVRFLVDREVEITGRTRGGSPPVTFTVINRQYEMLHYFLNHGAPTELVDFNTETALHHAAGNDDVRATKLLLQHGANPQAKTAKGQTPLDLARKMKASATTALLEKHQPKN